MKNPILTILLLGAGMPAAWAVGTAYSINYVNATTWILDWTDSTKFLPNTGYPNAPGDQLLTTIGNGGTYMPNTYQLNGDKTIGTFKKTLPYGKNTAMRPGTPTTSAVIWDTGVPGVAAVFQAFGAGGNVNNGDLRCASYVNMVLKSDLVWQGSTQRRYATSSATSTDVNGGGSGQFWGDISGAGKLFLQWNATKTNLEGGQPMNMSIEGGTQANSHIGGTEFNYFSKLTGQTPAATRAGFRLNKTWATGKGNTTVTPKSEIYVAAITGQDAIHDTTSLYLQSSDPNYGTVELNNTTQEQVAGVYFDGVLQAAGTWGSTLSAADNKNDTWFKGTGVLNIVYAPELAVEKPDSEGLLVDDSGTYTFPDTAPAGSTVKTFTIRNIGTATLTLTSVTHDGADSGDYTVGSPGSLVLAAGESTTFDVTFQPTVLGGPRNAAVHIISDDGDEAAFDFNISGTCAFPPTYIWKGPDNGAWNTAGNWENTIPGIGKVAVLSDATGGANIDIDSPSGTAGGLTFNNNVANQTIGSTGAFPLILNNDILIAPVTVSGSHTISAAIEAPRGMEISSPGPAGVLTLSGTSTAIGGTAANGAYVMDIQGTEVVLSGSMTLANNRSSQVVGNAKLTITGSFTTNGSSQIIGSEAQAGTGEVVLSGTGSWTHSGGGGFIVGDSGAANVGTLTINDSAVLNLGTDSIQIGIGGASGSTGVVNQNGGTVTNPSTWGTTFGSDVAGTNSATYHLNGGVHETHQIWGDGDGQNVFNFNGGTLKVLSDLYPAMFITGLTHAYVQDNGAIIDTNGFDVALDQALEHGTGAAIDGGLRKKSAGTLTLSLACSYTGNTIVEDGVLKLVNASSFADTSTVTIGTVAASPAVLDLPAAGTDTIAALVIDGSPAAAGKWGRIGSILDLSADFETDAITGDGLLDVGGVTPPTPYETWIAGPSGFFPGETDPLIIGPAANPDKDGDPNSVEFALGGNPDDGADNAKVFTLAADGSVDGDATNELLLTIAVRSGTPAFSGSPSPSATHDGFTYTVVGSTTLASFPLSVTPVAPVAPPAPNATPPAGYEWRTFSLDGSNGLPTRGFLRVEITP